MSDKTQRNYMVEVSVGDGTRVCTTPSALLSQKLLTVCENNNITTNAQLDTFLQSLSTVAALRAILIALLEGLCDVQPGP